MSERRAAALVILLMLVAAAVCALCALATERSTWNTDTSHLWTAK